MGEVYCTSQCTFTWGRHRDGRLNIEIANTDNFFLFRDEGDEKYRSIWNKKYLIPEYDGRTVGKCELKDDIRILIMRKGNLGDMIFTFPVIAQLRKSFPKCDIVFMGTMPHSQVVAPLVDQVLSIDQGGVDFGSFDLCLNLLYDPEGQFSDLLQNCGVDQVISCPFHVGSEVHQGLQMNSILQPIGIVVEDPLPHYPVPPSNRDGIAFHIGSSVAIKNWPVRNWMELILELGSITDRFLLTAGPVDDKNVEEFLKVLPFCPVLRDAPIDEVARSLSTYRLYIGSDTGITHLAAAVGTPTIAMYGATNPQVWAPLGSHVRMYCNASMKDRETNFINFSGAMDSIPVAPILSAAKKYYAELSNQR